LATNLDPVRRQSLYRDAEPFLRAIVDRPGDPLPRLIFADWLEEHGLDAEAAGQRWAAKHGHYPLGADPRDQVDLWRLPPIFRRCGYSISMGLVPETDFLKDCAEIAWGDDGEPIV
jgi:uncharacterized protein (TIGR02996 family)